MTEREQIEPETIAPESPNGLVNPNAVIRDYVKSEGSKDWKHTKTAKQLYEFGSVLARYLFAPRDETQLVLPQPLVAIDRTRIDALAWYRLIPNPTGLPYEIGLNEAWINRPIWELYESMTHEFVHLFQEYMAKQGVEGYHACKSGWHNTQFVDICEEVGLHPILGRGAHWRPADGQFARLMELLEIPKPRHAQEDCWVKPADGRTKTGYWWDDDRGGKPKGSSTLIQYIADECTRSPICKIRAGRRDLQIQCRVCGGEFRPHA